MKKNNKDRFNNTTTVMQAFERMLDEYKIRSKYTEGYILAEWDKIVGTTIAKHTEKIFIREKKLFLQTNSAPLKHHLSINKAQLINLLNEKAGIEIINELVLI